MKHRMETWYIMSEQSCSMVIIGSYGVDNHSFKVFLHWHHVLFWKYITHHVHMILMQRVYYELRKCTLGSNASREILEGSDGHLKSKILLCAVCHVMYSSQNKFIGKM